MLGLPRSYLFLHYQHQNLNFRKAHESSDVTALNSLLESSAFILIFLSPGQSMSPHLFFTHQLQDEVKRGPELYSHNKGKVLPQLAALHPSFEGSAPLWLEQKRSQKGGNPVVMTWCVLQLSLQPLQIPQTSWLLAISSWAGTTLSPLHGRTMCFMPAQRRKEDGEVLYELV